MPECLEDRLASAQVMMGNFNWPTTSVRLVAAVRTPEDRAAWERFSTRYGPMLLQFGERRGLQAADAEDMVQTVFIAVHRQVAGLDLSPERGRFRSWLSTIALRAIWKLRSTQLKKPCELCDPLELDRRYASQQEIEEELNQSVGDLAADLIRSEFDESTWEAFSAVWFRQERPSDVAARLGRPTSWVYKAKFNVLQRLKTIVRRLAHELDSV